MNMHVSKATAVVVQRIPAAGVDWFMEWQRGVDKAAGAFPGYRSTEVYPPPGGGEGEWVALLNFEEEAALEAWLESPVRQEWVEKLEARLGRFDLKVASGGFGAWFSGCASNAEEVPPGWKMVALVLLGLYPTVMVLTLFPGPYTSKLGLAVSMLIGNALSVSILQWGVMPVLNALFGRWLKANGPQQQRTSRIGLGIIIALLLGFAVFFHGVTG